MADIRISLALTGAKIVGDEFERIQKRTERLGNRLTSRFRSLNKTVDRTTRGFNGLRAAFGALGVGLLVRQMVRAEQSLQAIESSFNVAAGSAEGAAQMMQFVTSEADRLGLALEPTAKAFSSLAAAAKGTALEGEGSRQIFIGVSEAMTALGRTSADTEGALTAIEQIISKGNVSAEELRGQLGERLPGAFQIAARSIGVTTAQLDDMLKKGELSAEELLPKLAAELQKTFGAEAAARSKSLTAEINRFQTVLFEIVTGPNMDPLANSLRSLTTALQDPAIQEGFSGIAGSLLKIVEIGARAITKFTEIGRGLGILAAKATLAFEDMLDRAREFVDQVKTWLVDRFNSLVIEPMKRGLDKITGFFSGMKDAVVGNSIIPDMVDEIAREMGRLDDVMVRPAQDAAGKTTAAFGGIGGPIVDRPEDEQQRAVFEEFFSETGRLPEILRQVGIDFPRPLEQVLDVFNKKNASTLGKFGTALGALFERGIVGLGNVFGGFMSRLPDIFGGFTKTLGSIFTDFGRGFADLLGSFLGGSVSGFTSGTSDVLSTVGTAIGSFFGPIGGVIGGFAGSLLGGFFQTGGRRIVTGPTPILAGERGPELVSVTPLAGGAAAMGEQVINFNEAVVLDGISLNTFVRRISRAVQKDFGRTV